MQKLVFATSVLIATVAMASVALADVAPPDDYEEDCTRALEEGDDEYCEYRAGSYEDTRGCCDGEIGEGGVDACCDEIESQGWTHRCNTRGASYFDALWCRSRVQDDPPRPEVDDTGCSVTGSPTLASASMLLAIPILFGAFLWLRRSRRQ